MDVDTAILQVKVKDKASRIRYQALFDEGHVSAEATVEFQTPIRYWYDSRCDSIQRQIPTSATAGIDVKAGIWSFQKTDTSLLMSCSGVVLVNFTFAEAKSGCKDRWTGKKQIMFPSSSKGDTASDVYRIIQPLDPGD